MTHYAIIKEGQKPKEEHLKEIEALRDIEPIPDEDSPDFSYEEMKRMQLLAEEKRKERQKQVLTLRVSRDTLKKAKALGKGYTGILSRMLEMCLDDPKLIEKCL